MYVAIKKILESKLNGFSALPFVYDNIRSSNIEFVRVTFERLNNVSPSFGGSTRTERVTGFFNLSIWVKRDTATWTALGYAEQLASLYRNQSWELDGTSVEVLDIDIVPLGEDGNVYGTSVLVQYRAQKQYPVP